MSKHPVQEAFGFGEVMSETAGAEDIADAIETYAPFVAFSVADITTRNLERTRHVVLITGSAIRFYKYDATNAEDEDGETVIWDSEDRPFVLVQRGDRYDLKFQAGGLLSDGEEFWISLEATSYTIPAGMTGSRARVRVAPDSEAVFLLRKNNIEFATLTFAAGETEGVFVAPTATLISADDEISIIGPSPRNEALRTVFGTIVAYRDAA